MIALVAENEADIIVVDLGVNEKCSLEVDAAKCIVANGQTRITILRLHNFSTFVVDQPLRVDLGVADRVQCYRLICSEIG